MTYYLKSGNSFKPADEADLDLHKNLPAGNYIIKLDQFNNFYFEQVDSFSINHKLYGDNPRHTDRIIKTFLDRPNSTGILLTGEKGSGKSLLAKTISIAAAELGIPTLIINSPYHGDNFNKFIQDIEQPCIILFDEFEKIFDEDEQKGILTLLDGVFPSKKLFILTCNDKWRINQHMRNRPGRIYYAIDFTGLDTNFIVDYCNDNLNYPEHTDQICKISTMFSEFNFDMLKALVEEINRYGETPQEAIKLLNTKPEHDDNIKYNVELFVNDKLIESKDFHDSVWRGNPLASPFGLSYDRPEDDEYMLCNFSQQDLKELNSAIGKFVFVNQKNEKAVLTRARDVPFDYFSVF